MKSSELVRARQAARGIEPSSSMIKAIGEADKALVDAVGAIESGRIKADKSLIEPARSALEVLRITGDQADADTLADALLSLAGTFDHDWTNLHNVASLLHNPAKSRMLAAR